MATSLQNSHVLLFHSETYERRQVILSENGPWDGEGRGGSRFTQEYEGNGFRKKMVLTQGGSWFTQEYES